MAVKHIELSRTCIRTLELQNVTKTIIHFSFVEHLVQFWKVPLVYNNFPYNRGLSLLLYNNFPIVFILLTQNYTMWKRCLGSYYWYINLIRVQNGFGCYCYPTTNDRS